MTGDGWGDMANRALVLGGGGSAGVSWEIGVLTGLAAAGVDLSTADTVIGTCAGAMVGAQLTSGLLSIEEMYEHHLAGGPLDREVQPKRRVIFRNRIVALRIATVDTLRYGTDKPINAIVGRIALESRTPTEAEIRAVVARRLVCHDWPERRLLLTAVDAATGEFTTFDDSSGVGIVDAVTASSAVPGVCPPVTIQGRRWIHGDARSKTNADLAAGHDRVVILAPGIRDRGTWPTDRTHVARLRMAGARVALLTPDRATRRDFGRKRDPDRRTRATRAGRAQAAVHAEAVARLWSV